MTISHIVEILNEPQNKCIHKEYSIEWGWCIITSRSGAQLKLTTILVDKVIYEAINQVHLNNI